MGFWESAEAEYTALLSSGGEISFAAKTLHDFYQSFVYAGRWKSYLAGLGTTCEVAAAALLLGIILGVLVAVVRSMHDQRRVGARKNPLLGALNAVCKIYVTAIRGTPMMVQLLIMYFVVFAGTRNRLGVAMLAFGINSGAYVSEIIRGGIMSVDPGQTEAGRSLGLPNSVVMRCVVIPQAVKNILPALGNEFITLFKDTSIVTVIGLVDLTKVAIQIQSKTYQAFMPFIGIALIYLAAVMLMTWLLGLLERRLRRSDRR